MDSEDLPVTRRRFITGTAATAGAIAAAGVALPALGFAIAPVFHRPSASWQDIGEPSRFRSSDYTPVVITIEPAVGGAGLVGGPPPRPLDRFYTVIQHGRVLLGPRFSVNNELRRFAPRDPGQPLDGIGQFLYPPRFSTPPAPPGAGA